MFINVSNHPSRKWSQEQLQAAQELLYEDDAIVDIQFPNVAPDGATFDVQLLAEKLYEKIESMTFGTCFPTTVMVQGEFSLTHTLTNLLLKADYGCIVACSERSLQESILPDGTTSKKAVFKFVQFRKLYNPFI